MPRHWARCLVIALVSAGALAAPYSFDCSSLGAGATHTVPPATYTTVAITGTCTSSTVEIVDVVGTTLSVNELSTGSTLRMRHSTFAGAAHVIGGGGSGVNGASLVDVVFCDFSGGPIRFTNGIANLGALHFGNTTMANLLATSAGLAHNIVLAAVTNVGSIVFDGNTFTATSTAGAVSVSNIGFYGPVATLPAGVTFEHNVFVATAVAAVSNVATYDVTVTGVDGDFVLRNESWTVSNVGTTLPADCLALTDAAPPFAGTGSIRILGSTLIATNDPSVAGGRAHAVYIADTTFLSDVSFPLLEVDNSALSATSTSDAAATVYVVCGFPMHMVFTQATVHAASDLIDPAKITTNVQLGSSVSGIITRQLDIMGGVWTVDAKSTASAVAKTSGNLGDGFKMLRVWDASLTTTGLAGSDKTFKNLPGVVHASVDVRRSTLSIAGPDIVSLVYNIALGWGIQHGYLLIEDCTIVANTPASSGVYPAPSRNRCSTLPSRSAATSSPAQVVRRCTTSSGSVRTLPPRSKCRCFSWRGTS